MVGAAQQHSLLKQNIERQKACELRGRPIMLKEMSSQE